ncbi:MAG: 1-deoxy-D-xylulose-5-phosphate synthase, partial [Phycisphaerales bacterium]|nr:1-deoxy-D-xylulose-5-phosphate synthase [Phycisphaerales bacterium]
MLPRIMYIEDKSSGLEGPGRIGRVRFSQTGKSVYYGGRTFQTLRGSGFTANYFDVETGAEFWISGCKRRGGDRLYGRGIVEIDEDVREEYWVRIRGMGEGKDRRVVR